MEDKILNQEGIKLLKLGEELDLEVRNGNTEGDWKVEATYVGDQTGSVIDLILERRNRKMSVLQAMKIIERIESDHLPVGFTLQGKMGKEGWRKKKRRQDEENGKEEKGKVLQLKWKEAGRENYEGRVERADCDIGKAEKTAEERWNHLLQKVRQTGEELKMVRRKGNTERGNEEYEGEVRQQRKLVWKRLKEYLKTKGEEEKEALKQERRRLKEIRRRIRQEKADEKWRKVAGSNNANEFWEAVREYRSRKKICRAGIGKEDWLRHFKKLLDGKSEEDRQENEGEEENELNREIGLAEVERVLKKLKKNNTAGEDGIPGEFLKNLTREWIEEITEILNEL